MKNLRLAALLMFGCALSVQAQDITPLYQFFRTKMVILPVTKPWTSTGIKLNVGDSITVYVDGIASTGAYGSNPMVGWIGPEGYGGNLNTSGLPLTAAVPYSVIGRIGTSGSPFYVGRSFSFKANVADTFYLGYNDNLFSDNFGYYVCYLFGKSSGFSVSSSVQGIMGQIPRTINLEQNYPNPFNPGTRIDFQLQEKSTAEILIFNTVGQQVRRLFNEAEPAGHYSVNWDGRDDYGRLLPSGAYFYQLRAGESAEAKKMVLLK